MPKKKKIMPRKGPPTNLRRGGPHINKKKKSEEKDLELNMFYKQPEDINQAWWK